MEYIMIKWSTTTFEVKFFSSVDRHIHKHLNMCQLAFETIKKIKTISSNDLIFKFGMEAWIGYNSSNRSDKKTYHESNSYNISNIFHIQTAGDR